ncbi:hypothetical protein L484_020799 [Morus notabilis]|uniref:Uncharacterized protein n=1 Tax=Morus notabilis TaxID=981085 RepID=W9S358_9ROSA|nr:hypothetical protein L484_020799 [Morus notabilis]
MALEQLMHMVATAAAIDDRPSCFRFPRGNGIGAISGRLGFREQDGSLSGADRLGFVTSVACFRGRVAVGFDGRGSRGVLLDCWWSLGVYCSVDGDGCWKAGRFALVVLPEDHSVSPIFNVADLAPYVCDDSRTSPQPGENDDNATSDQQLEAMLLTTIEAFTREDVGLYEEPLGRVFRVFIVMKVEEDPSQEGDPIRTA